MKKTSTDFSICVIGHTGTVGSAVFRYFQKKKFPLIGASRSGKENISSVLFEKINSKSNVIFICVPTPFNEKTRAQDISIIEDILKNIAPQKIVVIKSTVLPGTTEALQQKYPNLNLLFNPEFLSRKTAYKDFQHPERQIIGYTKKTKKLASDILRLMPKGGFSQIITSTEAELIKYMHNVFGALCIIYANHLYDVCLKTDTRYQQVMQGFSAPKGLRGILRYTTIFHNKKRGFGGPCFPKDINSFIAFCNEIGTSIELIEATKTANLRILSSQGLTEKKAELY